MLSAYATTEVAITEAGSHAAATMSVPASLTYRLTSADVSQ